MRVVQPVEAGYVLPFWALVCCASRYLYWRRNACTLWAKRSSSAWDQGPSAGFGMPAVQGLPKSGGPFSVRLKPQAQSSAALDQGRSRAGGVPLGTQGSASASAETGKSKERGTDSRMDRTPARKLLDQILGLS